MTIVKRFIFEPNQLKFCASQIDRLLGGIQSMKIRAPFFAVSNALLLSLRRTVYNMIGTTHFRCNDRNYRARYRTAIELFNYVKIPSTCEKLCYTRSTSIIRSALITFLIRDYRDVWFHARSFSTIHFFSVYAQLLFITFYFYLI